jgi:transposase InsO family protein
VKYAFIERDLVGEFPLAVICRVLSVTQAGYHAWLKRPASAMNVARDALAELIKRVFAAFKGKYGAPRIYRELARQHGYTGSYERVRVLMRALGLKAKAGRKYKVTTDSKHALPIAPNLLGQDFTQTHASAPNQVWLSDITYLWTKEGWVFVACMLDLFTREIVGWAIDSHMRKSLVHDALKMAEFRNGFSEKRGVNGLIFHSDKGSQYAAHETRNHLQKMGYRQSMSGKGNCFDNAPMESFWHSLKVEETHGRGFETREEAKRCVFGYIEGFYNTTRMHSSINWQSPREFRRAFAVARRDAAAATVAPSATIKDEIIFNRKPRPPGEDMAESMSANQRNHLSSISAEMSAKQAPRISL